MRHHKVYQVFKDDPTGVFLRKKWSLRGRYILRRAKASISWCYQANANMSTIWLRFVISNSLFICFCFLTWLTKKTRILSSLTPLILDESIIRLGDCLAPLLSVCSKEFALNDFGDFISNSIPSRRISGVLWIDSGKNSTRWPASAKISATRNSCGQGCFPGGI